jgi:predicted aldo/keto reductase-like oxidoreductase
MVLSGMSHPDHVKENIKLAVETGQQQWTEKDEDTLKKVLGIIRGRKMVDCTACSYCMPCPEGVNIPQNFSLFNDYHMLQDPGAKLRYQRLLSETAKASSCIQCGLCEPQCPQNIPIRAELKHVDELLRT